jgi:hypothetical protein
MSSQTWSSSKPVVADPFVHFTKIRPVDDAIDVAYPRSSIMCVYDDPGSACVVIYFADGTSIVTRELFHSVLKRINE